MSRFTRATFDLTGETKGGRPVIRLTSPLVYEIDFLGSGWLVTAPEGFECDGLSAPLWANHLLPVEQMARSAIVHDRLRSEVRHSKLLGDWIFFEALGVEKVPLWLRLIAYAAVLTNFRRD